MNKTLLTIPAIFLLLGSSGCTCVKNTAANVVESPKIIWGSSTRALEKARRGAISKAFACSFQECFDAVAAIAVVEEKLSETPEEKQTREEKEAAEDNGPFKAVDLLADQSFKIFIKDTRKKMLVIYGIPGSVDTTEVGVFFVPGDDKKVTLEISSLSTNAKQTAARIIFEKLATQYTEVTQ